MRFIHTFRYNRRSTSQNLTESRDLLNQYQNTNHDRNNNSINKLNQSSKLPQRHTTSQSSSQKLSIEKYGGNYIFGVRLCMCLCALIECFGESMIVPYFQRAMGSECTSDYFGALLSLSAIAKFTASVITGLYICELGADKCMIFSFLLNALSMTLIGFNPWFNTPKIRDSGEINLINLTNSTSDGFSSDINSRCAWHRILAVHTLCRDSHL